jgi:Na+(H+)/acetate symporter ActP
MAYVAKKMVMPTNYVDMTTKDLEYEGSFSWRKFWTGVMVAGFALALATGVGGVLATGALATALGTTAGVSMVAGVVGLTGFSIEYKKEHPNM